MNEFVGRRKAFVEEMRHFEGLALSRGGIDSVEKGQGMVMADGG